MTEDRGEHDPLLDELRALFAQDDPVPPLVSEAARAALGWRRLDAELAELCGDSALDSRALALARGDAATLRSASFSSGVVTIDVEFHGEGADRTMLGQLSPPVRARVEVQAPAPGSSDDHRVRRPRALSDQAAGRALDPSTCDGWRAWLGEVDRDELAGALSWERRVGGAGAADAGDFGMYFFAVN